MCIYIYIYTLPIGSVSLEIVFFLKVFFFFLMWTIFKVCIEFTTTLLLLYVLILGGHDACGILVPRPGIEPALPALEVKVLTAGPPGKSFSGDLD